MSAALQALAEEDEDLFQDTPPPFYTVAPALQELHLEPEEGGWTWTSYDPVLDSDMPLPSIHKTIEEAKAASDTMTEILKPHNAGRYDLYSVLSTGRYVAYIFDGHPKPEPATRPRYE